MRILQRNQTTNSMISNEKMEEYWNRYRSEGVSRLILRLTLSSLGIYLRRSGCFFAILNYIQYKQFLNIYLTYKTS